MEAQLVTLTEIVSGLMGRGPGPKYFLKLIDNASSPDNLEAFEVELYNGSEFKVDSNLGASVEVCANGRYALITTPPAIWAYAARLPVKPVPLMESEELLIRVDLWVTRGAVGVGVAGRDGQFIAHETRSVRDGRTAVTMRLTSNNEPSEIVMRNAGRLAAKVVVERVQFYLLRNDLLGSVPLASASPTVSPESKPAAEAFSVCKAPSVHLSSQPLVSLILTVKNGLPYLPEALQSVREQTYGKIELVVQDCLSTDGGSELIAAFNGADVNHSRESDGGIGDANNRALARCRGDIIGTIDSDNLLEADAVARVVEYIASNPKFGVVYGSVRMISEGGRQENVFRPGPYDFLKFVTCDLVPPWSTAYFNRKVCGPSLSLDPMLKTCVDFDVWLRLSHLPIAFLDVVLGATRLSANSMTCRPENYDRFCRDKIFALKRYAEACAHEPLRDALIRHGISGIYCWAAESIKGIDPERVDLYTNYFDLANSIDPGSARVALAAGRLF